MSNIQTGAERMPHDLSHLGFLAGQIGRLITISTTPVIAGDSFEMDAVGGKEIQYLNAKGALTYTDIAGDPVLYGNLPPREISMKDVFRSGDSSKKFKIAEGQWYRYAPSYVSPAYHLLEG